MIVRKSKGEEVMKFEEEKVDVPSLVRIEEFLKSISKEYPVESLGGFVYWIKKQGAPVRWPFSMWKQRLEEYLGRII